MVFIFQKNNHFDGFTFVYNTFFNILKNLLEKNKKFSYSIKIKLKFIF